MTYKLATYKSDKGPRAGVIVDDRLYDAAALTRNSAYSTMLDIINDWGRAKGALKKAAAGAGKSKAKSRPLKGAKLLAPVLYPSAIYCAGANYTDHMMEMARLQNMPPSPDPHEVGLKPWHFIKASRCVTGEGATVKLPAASKAVDWEAELGAVIARPTRNISERDALSAVAGYLIVHDLSARDLMKREGSPFVYDWLGQKCFEDSAPMGPWLTPAAYVADPNDLAIRLWVNGVLKQDSNTGRMVHGIAEQIAYLSRHVTLWPGDVIATGTPAGVGMPRGEFLKVGDEVKIEIAGLGTLTNRMVADDA